MIFFTQLAPNAVQVSGMDLRLLSPVQWRAALTRMADRTQRSIRARYENEVTAANRRFKANTLRWNLFKAKKGYAPNRGQMLRRIIKRLRFDDLWSISAVTPSGTAVITFDEQYLYALEPHARNYATNKVPGGRILTVNALDIRRAGEIVKTSERLANERQLERLRKQRARVGNPIQIRPQQGQAAPRGRRLLTLALTAWNSVARTSAKLKLLGRF